MRDRDPVVHADTKVDACTGLKVADIIDRTLHIQHGGACHIPGLFDCAGHAQPVDEIGVGDLVVVPAEEEAEVGARRNAGQFFKLGLPDAVAALNHLLIPLLRLRH